MTGIADAAALEEIEMAVAARVDPPRSRFELTASGSEKFRSPRARRVRSENPGPRPWQAT
jgi:hypothetical protein